MHKILIHKINCRIRIELGTNDWIWVEGYVKSTNKDGTCWVVVPKSDDLYLCKEDEIWVNLGDTRDYYREAII